MAHKESPHPFGLRDAEDRRAIVERLDRNILVEAAAGTGKTTCLVSRMVALIREGRTTVERLTAVTFTLKAAAHLRETFQVSLERAAAAEADPERKSRLEEALRNISACFINTIHAFCARLLRERPVEAGVDPGFEEMDEPENLAARSEAWERYAEQLFVAESPRLPELTELGVSLESLRETYETISDNSDVVPAVAAGLPRPAFPAEHLTVEKYLDRVRPEIPETTPEDGWDKFASPLREALRLKAVLDLRREPELVRVLEAIERAEKPTQKRWTNGKRAMELWAECQTLQEEVVRPALRRWCEYLHPVLINAITPAVEEFARYRRQQGRLNFQDLLLLARDLLKNHSQVRRAFRERFTPILVDEFQDTDPIQAEVLLYLTGEEIAEKDWRKLTPAPGSLFVVGDPKQSIYRFRRADIETYNRVRERIQKTDGEVYHLTTNFRSSEKICAWVNGVFTVLLPESSTAEQAAHVALVPYRTEEDAESGVFRLDVPAEGKTKDPEVVRWDAATVAEWVGAAIADKKRGLVPADVLILSRYRRNLPTYARALESRGIPYEIAGGGAFRDSAELKALLPFLQALADPDNPVPLVAALRGPLFGVDDAALYRFKRAGGRFSFLTDAPDGADARILRAWELFREGERLMDSLPPGAAIARLCERLGWIAAGAAEALGETRAGNLLKALTAARKFSGLGEEFGSVVERLTDMTEEGETEEMSTEPGRSNAVALMTLHRAKGLEAKVVFLADPVVGRDQEPTLWIDRNAEPPEGHFVIRRKTSEFGVVDVARPLNWDEKVAREQAFEDAEKIRLLYVAGTRAKQVLIVSLKRQQNKDGTVKIKGPWCQLEPWLKQPLEKPALGPAQAPPTPLRGVPKALAAFEERHAARLSAAIQPGYSVTQVTAVAHAAGTSLPFSQRTGRGMSWGRVLHRLLEALMKNPSLDLGAFAANLLAEEERPAGDLDEAVRLAEGVRDSDLWARALAAKRRFVEVPFALTVPSADLGAAEGPAETLLHGAVDLVFEEKGGWVVVDYKSDTVSGKLEELTTFYAPQLAFYRRYWEELTGQPTKAGLYFLDSGEEVWFDAPAVS